MDRGGLDLKGSVMLHKWCLLSIRLKRDTKRYHGNKKCVPEDTMRYLRWKWVWYHKISIINESEVGYHEKSGINKAEYHKIPTFVTKNLTKSHQHYVLSKAENLMLPDVDNLMLSKLSSLGVS